MAQYTDVTIAFYSDDGTNLYTITKHQQYQRYYRPKKLSWHFNTPLASTQGGAWEHFICSVRRLLSHLPLDPQNVPVSSDVLRTMLAGAQKIINVRSLTSVRVLMTMMLSRLPLSCIINQ